MFPGNKDWLSLRHLHRLECTRKVMAANIEDSIHTENIPVRRQHLLITKN